MRGDQLVELELTGVVEAQQPDDVVLRVARAEQRTLDRLLVQRQVVPGDVHGELGRVGEAGDDDGAALADDGGRAVTTSSSTVPTRMRAWSAPWPQVSSLTFSAAAAASAKAWVAPNFRAVSRFNATGSTTTTYFAPALTAPWTALMPESADAVDDDGVPGADAAGVDRGAPTGRHTTADEDGGLQRQPVVDLHHRVLRDGGALGERAEHAHGTEILLARVEPERAVGHEALEDGGAHVAEVLAAGRAVAAGPAVRDEAADHVVAGLHLGDAGADFLDDAGTLVAADDGETGGRSPSVRCRSEWHRPAATYLMSTSPGPGRRARVPRFRTAGGSRSGQRHESSSSLRFRVAGRMDQRGRSRRTWSPGSPRGCPGEVAAVAGLR